MSQTIVINRLALLQTRLIQTTKGVGTAFAGNVDDREYWITAKHIFSGIENAPPGVFTTKTVQANILLPFSKGDKEALRTAGQETGATNLRRPVAGGPGLETGATNFRRPVRDADSARGKY